MKVDDPAAGATPSACLDWPHAELYSELKTLARRFLRHERPDSLLQATALVHETCLRLLGYGGRQADRAEVLGLASIAMRNLLVDRARHRRARRWEGERVEFESLAAAYEDRAWDLLALHEALENLEQFDPVMARAVDLRFFGGLSMEQTAGMLRMPLRTLERRWEVTRAWLKCEME